MDDQRRVVVRYPALDRCLERAAGDVQRAGDGALLVLVGLADVEHDGARLLAQLVGLGGVDLADLGLGGVQQLSEVRHDDFKCSSLGYQNAACPEKATETVNNHSNAGIPGGWVSPA